MNQISIVGRLTKDPVLKELTDAKTNTHFSIAVNRNFRNSEGKIEADYLACIAWGRIAERIVKHCGKGSLLGINGRLQNRSYMNKDNHRIYTTEIVVEDVRFYVLKERETIEKPFNIDDHFTLPTM